VGYEDVLPYFKKGESDHHGASDVHGADGPVRIEPAGWQNPLADAFIDAASATLGLRKNDDFNGRDTEGAGYWDLIARNGWRQSTSQVYLKPARKRRNLHVVTGARVTKVDFDGRKAVGVTYRKDGQTLQARATGDIVLSAGALRTPQLLQLSGIGPARLLADHGIDVVHALEGVGENLVDHVQTGRRYATTSEHTFNAKLGTPLAQVGQGLRFLAGRRDGPLTIGASLAGAYLKTLPDGGFVVPMHRHEALWLGLQGDWPPCAVKVGAGSVCALSGERFDGRRLTADPQDYLVLPDQPWIDGINAGDGWVRQFVAVPLGAGRSVEARVGEPEEGGLRLSLFDPVPGRFPDEEPSLEVRSCDMLAPAAMPSDAMAIGAGGRIRQELYPDTYGIEGDAARRLGRRRGGGTAHRRLDGRPP